MELGTIERMVRLAIEVVAGRAPATLRVDVRDAHVWVVDEDGAGFGVGAEQLSDLDEDPDAALRHVLDLVTDELAETREFWGLRLPLCPEHADRHALAVRLLPESVVAVCPTLGPLRTVRR